MLTWIKNLFKKKSAEPRHFQEDTKERTAYLEAQEKADYPWASFEIAGFEDDGRVKVQFHWNSEFIKTINQLGFQAETEDDTVQLFFYAAQLKPLQLSFMDPDDQPVKSAQHPNLGS